MIRATVLIYKSLERGLLMTLVGTAFKRFQYPELGEFV
jgi:hypothetical protein